MTKNITSLIYATLGTIWFVVVITVWGELSEPFKKSLKSVTGHHWTTKSVFSVILFFLIYLAFLKAKENPNAKKSVSLVLWSAILGGLIIFLFYIWHFFA